MNLDLSDLQPRRHDASHVTPDQVRQVEDYMARLLHALDLGYWKVHVAKDLPPEDAKLMIWPTDGRRVTHEALHLAHHDTEEHIRRWLNESGDVADYVKGLVISQFKTNLERMVDSLSYVVGSFMPQWVDEPDADQAAETDSPAS